MLEKPVRLKSFAKVNLYLRITGKLPNGYHTLYSIFQEIDFFDVLTFVPSKKFNISCNQNDLLCDDKNLCVKAYRTMKEFALKTSEWSIHLEKNIPVGAGLGGGSSNSAAVIKFLNREWNINLSENELINIAKKISADAPFFIRGKTQIATGIGENLKPIQLPEKFTILLVCPKIHISTAWAYSQIDLTINKENFKFHDLFNKKKVSWELFENQFETVVFPAYPEVGKIKEDLISEDAKYAGLSGSGSTVFGVFNNIDEAKSAQRRFINYTSFISNPIFW